MTTAALRFAKLLRKELESYKVLVFFLAAAIILWGIFLVTRTSRWHPDAILGLSVLPITIVIFWSFLSAVLRLRQEWDGNHVHLILPLPVPGWYITGAKVLATLLEIIALTLLVIVCATIVGRNPFLMRFDGVPEVYSVADIVCMSLQALAVFWLSLCMVTVLVQFACISGRLYERFSGLISVWVLVLSVWVSAKFGALVEPALRWLPDFRFKSIMVADDYVSVETVMLSSSPLASALLWSLILLLTGSWLLDRHIEI